MPTQSQLFCLSGLYPDIGSPVQNPCPFPVIYIFLTGNATFSSMTGIGWKRMLLDQKKYIKQSNGAILILLQNKAI
jgi:hypothetical protein